MYGVVYKITNIITNKIYIGQTIRSIEQRFKEHSNCKFNRPLYNSIRKHGIENFIIEIIDTSQSFEELNELEIKYIKEYNATNLKFGYNLSEGGNTPILRGEHNGMFGKKHTEEVKRNLSISLKGKTWEQRLGIEKAQIAKQKLIKAHTGMTRTDETKRKISEKQWLKNNGHLITGEKNPNFGHYWSDEQKLKVTGENNGMYGNGHLITGEKNGMYGKKHTEEARAKMSKSRKGEGNPRYYALNEKILNEIKNDYNMGYSLPYLENKYKIKRGKIRRELKKLNIIMRNVSEQKIKNYEIKQMLYEKEDL